MGDVPLVLTTDYENNSKLPRTSVSAVYQQMITDLKESYTLLNDNYVDATGTEVTNERVRPNKSAAAALLARVYLYTGQKLCGCRSPGSLVISIVHFIVFRRLIAFFY